MGTNITGTTYSYSSAMPNRSSMSQIQSLLKEKLKTGDVDTRFLAKDEDVAATVTISESASEKQKKLEEVRKIWAENNFSGDLFKGSAYMVKNDDGMYRIANVIFSEEDVKDATSLLNGVRKETSGTFLEYSDYAAMELSETLVDKMASERFSKEQAAVINNAMKYYNESLISNQDRIINSSTTKENSNPIANKYYGVMMEVPKEVMDDFRKMFGVTNGGAGYYAGTDIATNQELIEELRNGVKNIDVLDGKGTDKLKAFYEGKMKPVYYAKYSVVLDSSVTNVLKRDVEALTKMIDFAKEWKKKSESSAVAEG